MYERIIRLWDLLADGERYRFTQSSEVSTFRFSPDGRTLAAVGYDGPVLLWDVYGLLTGTAVITPTTLARAWEDLASLDAGVGFRAVRVFAASGADGLSVIRERMLNVKPLLGSAGQESELPQERNTGSSIDQQISRFGETQIEDAVLRHRSVAGDEYCSTRVNSDPPQWPDSD